MHIFGFNPLFLNNLRQEFDTILEEKVEKQRVKQLDAHQQNDRAVMDTYGFNPQWIEGKESLIVAGLFKRYQALTK